ncbi:MULTISPECIES: phosphonate metabolism protein/1,5-bisphosphokinase (PRPP-forming) PhnN [Rhizobium/Agrobacterium group]|uniref:phosphonate metabolism protein/1,5-bisphosphokinase (PRPP-forming) PhnN n=1 Tax=Rhizobium/Agrobacterium group TaxID=227290 RepID=UPI0013872E0D|nr:MULTISPECIES: phosphonate metabolism protein/1,5-bisphosphokinase (PRPP-forming) PhnN [Rhizobium/Agrobacterium group]MCZ7479860.1 phosphonate metabolism protein/1,5-bisphosphokinase (PRPP-forming) PhnN [Rhizobium rhizogenes]MCZ7484278.1 phosphonate metabolism protein/1,5-bisphosphokinase (PRPP-forming) PhnN [Rhizobium rhizogenes]MDO3443343.1 phosphonate metabolism protein/1,5-bisphosphokinase (PRPP-forming) PhnN [Agrobacterium sp. V1]
MTGNGEGSRREKTPGTMIVVVGPSGAGKDTLMDYAATQLSGRPGFHFTRRVITRSGDAGGENHDAVSMQEFNRLQDEGAFAVSWQAHGLKYGIPAAVYRQLEAGDVVIANGSRSALPEFSSAFSRLRVVNIVARPEVLARRLEQRGRESREDILRRLERSSLAVVGDFDVTTVDNSGAIEDAGKTIMQVLEQSAGRD